jgi:cytochrome P450
LSTPFDFTPESPAFYDQGADDAFAHLRANDPVHWYEPGGFWCLTRQAEIREVSRQPRVFSSTRGLQMWQIPVQRAGGEVAPAAADGAASILEMDPPEHIRHRRLVTSAFTPRYLQKLEDRIREITTETLDAVDPTDDVEFVEQIAVPLPMIVIAEMIGVPAGDRDRFRRWSDSIIEAGGGGMTEASINDLAELYGYFTNSLADHRATPRDDLITLLLDAELDGERLSEGEILMFLMTLLVAGNETTRNLISGGARALADHPDQRAWLAADPERIPNAVEEMLRWVSPTRSFVRYAQSDTTVGETPVSAGQHLVMFYGSGNRDPDVFGPTADRFDASRADANRHVAFGFGEHLCLGAALARLEARIMFEELLRRWPDWRLAGEPAHLSSCLINGLVHLPVRFA